VHLNREHCEWRRDTHITQTTLPKGYSPANGHDTLHQINNPRKTPDIDTFQISNLL